MLLQDGDTSFLFSIPQSKFIAKSLSNGFYCDSIRLIQDDKIKSLEKLNSLCQYDYLLLRKRETNLNAIVENKNAEIQGLNISVSNYQKKLKKQKRLGLAIIAVTVGIIIVK